MEPVLDLMMKMGYKEEEMLCLLMFEEVSVRGIWEYNPKTDTIFKPASKAQVFMTKGILKNWRQGVVD